MKNICRKVEVALLSLVVILNIIGTVGYIIKSLTPSYEVSILNSVFIVCATLIIMWQNKTIREYEDNTEFGNQLIDWLTQISIADKKDL